MTLPTQHTAPIAAPARVGQATAVEQSRAVAEVQAAVVVAQQVPRRLDVARTAMQESCAQLGLADRAFYSFPRGGQTVAGPTVYLARELARCWGNVQHGIAELRRDDVHGESEMQAWAWDVQTNTRTSHTFVVPHKRDTKKGAVPLVDLRDIYENNANQGARRLREAIFAILPPWFTEEAVDICRGTLEHGDGRPLADRIDAAVGAYEGLGITVGRLEQKLGRPRGQWTGPDLAQLRITHKSIQRGELTVDETFPQARVTAAELVPPAPAPHPAAPVDDTPAPVVEVEQPAAEERTPSEDTVVDLMGALEDSVAAAKADRTLVAGGPVPDLDAAAKAGQDAADRVTKRNAAGQAPPPAITARQIATKSAALFAEHTEVGPRGGKSTRTIDRLRHALVYAVTGRRTASASDCTPDELLRVWQRMDDIAEGKLTYELELEVGVAFTSGTGTITTIAWDELETDDGGAG